MPDEGKKSSKKKRPKGVGKARMSRELGLRKKHRAAVAPESAAEGVQLSRVRVVLAGPRGAANIGQVARAMLNMGLTRLYLVDPTPRWRSSESRQMAVGAAWELLKNATVTKTLPEALEGCVYSLAMTAAKGRTRVRVKNFEDVLPRFSKSSHEGDVALVFGNEVTGLSNEEIHLCHESARLLVSDTYSSLNLAQAVLLASSRVFSWKRELPKVANAAPLAVYEDLERFYQQLWDILERTRFLPKQSPHLLFEQIRVLFGKLPLEEREVRILRGILSHFEWNLDNPGKIAPPAKKQAG